jgi:hypothetical protein
MDDTFGSEWSGVQDLKAQQSLRNLPENFGRIPNRFQRRCGTERLPKKKYINKQAADIGTT